MEQETQERYLVLGAGGAQGGSVARALVARGHRVWGLTRSGAGLPEGVGSRVADLGSPDRVAAAFTGMTRVSAVLPLEYGADRVACYVRSVTAAAAAAGVRRLVFNTGVRIPVGGTGVPALRTRVEAEDAVLASKVPAVVLRPPVYLENLCAPWVSGPLLGEGILRYPLPEEAGVAWLSHGDLAEATVAALHGPGLEGAVLDVGGAEVLTGAGLADAFGAVLGRSVRYEAQDPDVFEALLAPVLGSGAAAGVASTYRWAAEDPGANAADPLPVSRALGVRPRPVREWIAAQRWPEPVGGVR